MTDKYTCQHCGRTLTKGRSDAEADAEYRALNPKLARVGAETATICDDCHREFMTWWNSLTPAKRVEFEAEAIREATER